MYFIETLEILLIMLYHSETSQEKLSSFSHCVIYGSLCIGSIKILYMIDIRPVVRLPFLVTQDCSNRDNVDW